MKQKHSIRAALALLFATGLIGSSLAAELPVGTTISKANLDQVKNDTFEGKTIASMLPERLEMQIRNYGLNIKLKKTVVTSMDPKSVEATRKYAGEVKYDAAKNEVSGYKAGLPFPDVKPDDPNYAAKLVWNLYYASPTGQVMDFKKFAFLLVDQEKGLERQQNWFFMRYFMKNRLTGSAAPVDGDGSEFTRTLLFATYPQDIRGLGTYTIRYDGAQYEDQWVYIKNARRTRRLAGGAWMDPIGGTDQLNDDIEVWNARPSWYKSYKYVTKRWVLAIANGSRAWDESKKGTADEFPTVDLANAPFWNPKDEWEPREVHVIEATPPAEHPYSKKTIYIDTQIPRVHFGEAYDRKGEFWKWMSYSTRSIKGDDGVTNYVSNQGHTLDFKRKHGTVFISHPSWKTNTAVKADDVTLGKLEAAGQ
ncbi:MAG: DUF1329 domain-containing protein [Burkholderiaceae bacterium]|nr:DUF1329 domain-containing protein [Burkholderiaceae bacterium]